MSTNLSVAELAAAALLGTECCFLLVLFGCIEPRLYAEYWTRKIGVVVEGPQPLSAAATMAGMSEVRAAWLLSSRNGTSVGPCLSPLQRSHGVVVITFV